jgi:hypothetical protein
MVTSRPELPTLVPATHFNGKRRNKKHAGSQKLLKLHAV